MAPVRTLQMVSQKDLHTPSRRWAGKESGPHKVKTKTNVRPQCNSLPSQVRDEDPVKSGTDPHPPGRTKTGAQVDQFPIKSPGWGVKILHHGGRGHLHLMPLPPLQTPLLPSSPHTVLPPFWPACNFQNMPVSPSPPGWCLCYSLCPDHSPPTLPSLHLANIHSFLHLS